MKNHSPTRRKNKPITIGVFVVLYGGYHDAITSGITEVVQKYGGNVICFVGAAINDIVGFRKHWNGIYDLASSANLDGLVILSNALGEFVTFEELSRFCARYTPLPTVSIGHKLEGIANITNDGSTGMADLMTHLIEHHHYQRIAFLKGPEDDHEAQVRYRAYTDALTNHKLPLDSNLILPGNYLEYSGVDAIKILLDERKIMPEVIVAANDGMAISAWGELARRGIEIPRDLALTGFDNMVAASSFSTPLSTVNQSLPEQGRIAARMLIEHVLHGAPLEDYTLGTEMVVRESCGCLPAQVTSGLGNQPGRSGSSEADFETHRVAALTEIQNVISGSFPHIDRNDIEAVVNAFFAALRGEPAFQFVSLFRRLLQTASSKLVYSQLESGIMSCWHDTVSILTDKALLGDDPRQMINLVQQARILVSRAAERAHSDLKNQAAQDALIQAEIMRDISSMEDVHQMADILAERLPELRISTSAISLYDGNDVPSKMSRLMMACDAGKKLDVGPAGRDFPSSQLVPPDVLPRAKWGLLTLHPLVAHDIQFGFIVMELVPGSLSMFTHYMSLSEQIGATLFRALLQDRIRQMNKELLKANAQLKTLNVEIEASRQEAERANAVKSQFLASMSHELRTPLNSIINFSKFVGKGMLGPVNPEQTEALDIVIASGNHLLSLINDVLDISKIESGSLNLFVEVDVDLNEEVKAVISAGRAMLSAKDKPVELVADIQPGLPPVVVDRRRVRQIMLNLVSNACKFTKEGQVRITLHQDGDDVLFAVHDTGPGIAPEDHEIIFETFRQTDVGLKQGEGTGLGLPISRRLAEIHGGCLWLESRLGEGASFYVRLPIRSEHLLSLVHGK